MMTPQIILLVEDDPNDIVLTQRAFRKANLTNASLQVITDGDSAVAYLSGEGEYSDRDRYPLPVVTLLDLKLPRRSGHEILAWLKEEPELRRLPMVVLTSSNLKSDLDKAYDLGANSYLVKPIGLAPLVEVLQALNLYWLLLNEKPDIRQS